MTQNRRLLPQTVKNKTEEFLDAVLFNEQYERDNKIEMESISGSADEKIALLEGVITRIIQRLNRED